MKLRNIFASDKNTTVTVDSADDAISGQDAVKPWLNDGLMYSLQLIGTALIVFVAGIRWSVFYVCITLAIISVLSVFSKRGSMHIFRVALILLCAVVVCDILKMKTQSGYYAAYSFLLMLLGAVGVIISSVSKRLV